ncbi:MAG: metal-dependent hydrolase [Moraxellaceae bacterium]|nr:metal-dependent hydrolase [Moraxellaceae bacterium]
MSTQTMTPVGTANIPVRRMDFEFDDAIPKYWFDNNPMLTMLLTGLSCVFPEGERMFMRAVRHYQDQITDPELQKEVRAFIGQEAHHGKEHQAFNDFMAKKDLPIARIEAFVKKAIAFEEKNLSKERMLAKTCALEHFNAIFAEMILENPQFLDGIDDRLKPLWLWHAIEESEHKAVAFDVYQKTVDNYWIRSSEMAVTTVMFSFFTGLHTVELMRASGEQRNIKAIAQGLNKLLGKKGFFRGMLPHYLAYYRPDFHPNDRDSTQLRNKGLALLKSYLGDKIALAA